LILGAATMKKHPPYRYVEYPKCLYLGGTVGSDCITVDDAAGEETAAARGYYPHGAVTALTPDPDAMRVEAEKLGVKVDKRWGADRLRAEIERAKQ
jgi:hypothetical protein